MGILLQILLSLLWLASQSYFCICHGFWGSEEKRDPCFLTFLPICLRCRSVAFSLLWLMWHFVDFSDDAIIFQAKDDVVYPVSTVDCGFSALPVSGRWSSSQLRQDRCLCCLCPHRRWVFHPLFKPVVGVKGGSSLVHF